MLDFWMKVRNRLADGQKVFACLVAENEKGSPGTAGAKLGVAQDGEVFGTVGGGIMEFNIIKRAKSILAGSQEFETELQTLHHKKECEGEKSGMICAGSQTNIYRVFKPREYALIAKAVDLMQRRCSGQILIGKNSFDVVLGIAPLDRSTMLVHRESDWRYSEELLNRRRLAVIGGGHCAGALCTTMVSLGYEVTVFEARRDLQLMNGNGARVVYIDDWLEAGSGIDYPDLTCVVVMTPGFKSDVRALLGVVERPFPFIGIMGSQNKIDNIFLALKKAGIATEKLDHIHAPVGLEMNSDTPQEIAVSVAAQILRERNILKTIPR